MNQTIRRLERIESELLAERNARVDDLGAARRPDRLRLARRSTTASQRIEDAHRRRRSQDATRATASAKPA